MKWPSKRVSITSIRSSHFTLATPYQPGAMSRSGAPWPVSRGAPFISYQGPRRKSDAAWPYFADPVALARECDFLVAACPGGEETRGLVSRAVLEALGPEGVVVNISRGSVIDEPAMVELLQAGKLGGAGLDVFEHEPEVPQALLAMDNVVLQPHVGSATHPTRRAMGQLVIDNLALYFSGKPLRTPY